MGPLRILRLVLRGGQQIRIVTTDPVCEDVRDLWTQYISGSVQIEDQPPPQRIVRVPDEAGEGLISASIDLSEVIAVAVYLRNDRGDEGAYA